MKENFYKSVKNELFDSILPYWEQYARDPVNKGFYGQIDNDNNRNTACERSIVMTSRFLWTYSAIARLSKNPKYLEMADFAYEVILTKFWDKKHGGVFWSVMPDGKPKISKKQIYGEAFCCYGLSEYAAAVKELRENLGGESLPLSPASQLSSATPSAVDTPATPPVRSEEAMNYALDIYSFLEKYARDMDDGGYVEARAQNWKATKDMILSPKDMNCPKSMNTNLHVMEAYTNLYRTLPVVFSDIGPVQKEVGESLSDLVRITVQYILQPNAHLGMFFDMNWNLLDDEISYGHDIEVSWLLWEAVCELKDEELKSEIKETVIHIAQVALDEGFDSENGCMENFLKEHGTVRDRRRVWWIQAEAINGFYNAWEMSGDEKYEKACDQIWNWILNYQKDKINGEWFAELTVEGEPISTENKGGNWKTSYHNGRTCMEVLKRSNNF